MALPVYTQATNVDIPGPLSYSSTKTEVRMVAINVLYCHLFARCHQLVLNMGLLPSCRGASCVYRWLSVRRLQCRPDHLCWWRRHHTLSTSTLMITITLLHQHLQMECVEWVQSKHHVIQKPHSGLEFKVSKMKGCGIRKYHIQVAPLAKKSSYQTWDSSPIYGGTLVFFQAPTPVYK